MQTDYDIVIIGGGLVGSCLACALAPAGLRIAVLDQHPPVSELPPQPDLRVSAITLATRAIFKALEAWPLIPAERIAALREMLIWDAAGSGQLHFDSAEIGAPELGYIIENSAMLYALQTRLQHFPHVQYLPGDALQQFVLQDDAVQLDTTAGKSMSCRLLVGADGAASRVRTLAGIDSGGWEFAQQGIVATIRCELAHANIARQRFLPTGPLAFLPLSDTHLCSIVWSADTRRAQELCSLSPLQFDAALQAAFGDSLGQLQSVSERAAFPLNLAHAREYVRPRLALVGDAAHRVHPLAGQGVNLGFADAASLAQVLLQARSLGKEIGAYTVLRRYERWRKGDNLAMLALTDGLKRLFGSHDSTLTWLRNRGMDATNAVVPLKRKLMRLASGLDGDLPMIARTAGMY